MSRNSAQYHQKLRPPDPLDEMMIRSGLAELVPRSQRGRAPLLLQVMLLLAALVGLLGLPLGGMLLLLVLALILEAVDYQRRQLCPFSIALARRSMWDHIRPPFYWTVVAGAGLLFLLFAEASLVASLLRAGFLWLCFRGIEDSVKHPERYNSLTSFWGWLKRLGQQVARPWSLWFDFIVLGITASFVLNLIAPGIWQSVGHTEWDRLVLLLAGIYLLASLAFFRSSKAMARVAVGEGIQNWDTEQITNLDEVLASAQAAPAFAYTNHGYAEQAAEQLRWKMVDHLVSRVGVALESTLAQRLRWSAFLASGLAFLLAFLFLGVSAFLIVPREVLASWVSGGQVGGPQVLLAFDDFEELFNLEFEDRVLALDRPGLGREPLPKVVFLEAALLVSLLVLRTAYDHAALRSMANAGPASIRRELLLGTSYLALREKGFQHLYSGFVTRQLAGNQTLRTITLENEVLLAPAVATRVSAYRAISDFLGLYGHPQAWRSSTYLITVFASYRFAQVWATTFLRSPSATEFPGFVEREAFLKSEAPPGKFWIWSGEQLTDLTSLEEAQWYGRFVPR